MTRFTSLQDWLKWQENFHSKAIDLGLDRIQQVFETLHPNYSKPPTVTVAGTNGKGSCIAFLEAIYRAQGYRVGTYTSPHILKYNERIKIDGCSVSDPRICLAFERIESVRNNTSLSYFEFGTLAALDIFAHANLDVQLLEVGLGGRLDAVNIVDPDVAIISSISIDHADWLGETRELIGREKAGIFRPQVPAVIGDPNPPESISEYARENNTPLFFMGKHFSYERYPKSWNWCDQNTELKALPIPYLKGEHQYQNAASVLMGISKMQAFLPVSETAIREGLQQVRLTGRFQFINRPKPVLLDVGHNPHAALTLLAHVREYFPGKRIYAVFSMMKDKDIQGVIEIMKPVIKDWFFAPLPDNPRCVSEQKLQELFADSEVARAHFGFPGFHEAFAAAEKKAKNNDLVLVFGSFFLVSEFLGSQVELSI